MELKLGEMTNEELAQWFGTTSKNNFQKHKTRFLEKLQSFAVFTPKRGGVDITEIIIPEYVKNLDDDVRTYKEIVETQPNHLTSISKIVSDLQCTKEYQNISSSTLQKRMTVAGKKAFGITSEKDSRGIYGSREYVWCIKLYSGPQHYRFLTEEEKKIFDELTSSYYAENTDKVQQAALLDNAFAKTDMTKEEYLSKKELLGLNLFSNVIYHFKDKTGLQIVRATRHEIEQCMSAFAAE